MSKITPGKKRFVKRVLSEDRPTVWIGKAGASNEIVKEIEKQLARNLMVKCKILKSGLPSGEAKLVAATVADQTGSVLVEVRGHTFMLYKRRKA